jgi:hypothetical protein
MKIHPRTFSAVFWMLGLTVILGCGAFVSPYDARSYEYLTELKAYHLKFIDDFTEGPGKSWNEQAVSQACDAGDLKFKEAIEYEKGKPSPDQTRLNAFMILNDEFHDNCKELMQKGRLFSPSYSAEKRAEIEQNYNLAIKGETIRNQ